MGLKFKKERKNRINQAFRVISNPLKFIKNKSVYEACQFNIIDNRLIKLLHLVNFDFIAISVSIFQAFSLASLITLLGRL